MLKNEKIQIGVENPLILESSDNLWMIINGEANVFYTQVDRMEIICQR